MKKATRQSFGEELARLKNPNIVVLDADLSSSTKTDIFAKTNMDRFFEIGISESDMIGTAAGFATCGKIPFAATFAAFATGRVYDQIRCSVCYPNLPVKICGTHAGVTVGQDGATHQMLEDVGLMRGLPNMKVFVPSDEVSTKKIVQLMVDDPSPNYLRLSRFKTDQVYTEETEFRIGGSHQIGEGVDGTIFTNGDTLNECLKARQSLLNLGLDIRVVDLYSVKPVDKQAIIRAAKQTGILFTVEDHSTIGGLGSIVSEVLCESAPKTLHKIGVQDQFGQSGRPEELMQLYGINSIKIVEKVRQVFSI